MKKNYFTPMTKVVTMNVNHSFMEPSMGNMSNTPVREESSGDAPLF